MSDTFDLSSASAGALSHLDGSTAPEAQTPAAPVTPETTPAPTGQVAPAGEVATPPATPAAKTYKVKVDGEELEVPENELLGGYSRTAKFTKDMMSLAEQRKAFEAERQSALQREAQLNDFFRDPNNIARYYEHLTGKPLTPAQQQALATQQPQAQPDEFATMSNVERMAAEKAAQVQAQLTEQVNRQMQETQRWTTSQIEKARIEADQQRKAIEYHGEITGTVNSLLTEYPDLKAMDNIEELLCLDAQRMGPRSLDEAKAALLNVAKARAEKLSAHFTEMQKKSAVERTKLQTQGIEPPGGTGVTPQPTSFKLGSKELSSAAAEWLEKASKKK